MERKDKVTITLLIIILVILLFNIVSTILNSFDYEKRKESGNERWLQVENRILQTEEKVNQLEEEIEQWKQ